MKNTSPHWADRAVAIFTGLMLITYITSNYFACQTLDEIKSGGKDTRELAIAAKAQAAQADRLINETHTLAAAAKTQAESSKIIAENAREAASAAKAQAAVSARAADAAERAIQITESPNLQIDHVECSTAPKTLVIDTEVAIIFKNTGRGAATSVRSAFYLSLFANDVMPLFNGSESTVGAGGSLESGRLKVSDALNTQALAAVDEGFPELHLWGWLSYRDPFRVNHLLVFDSTYMPKTPCGFLVGRIVSRP